jgi:hypothetical protein
MREASQAGIAVEALRMAVEGQRPSLMSSDIRLAASDI